MTVAYVGLGANIGEPRRQLEAATERLKNLPATKLVRLSGFTEARPWGTWTSRIS